MWSPVYGNWSANSISARALLLSDTLCGRDEFYTLHNAEQWHPCIRMQRDLWASKEQYRFDIWYANKVAIVSFPTVLSLQRRMIKKMGLCPLQREMLTVLWANTIADKKANFIILPRLQISIAYFCLLSVGKHTFFHLPFFHDMRGLGGVVVDVCLLELNSPLFSPFWTDI